MVTLAEVEGTEDVPEVEVVVAEIAVTMGEWEPEVVEEALEVTEEDTEAAVEAGEADCVDKDQNYDVNTTLGEHIVWFCHVKVSW